MFCYNGTMIKLTIIIPVYNAEKYLGRCLKSVQNTLLNADFESEIIIVDNGSTDESCKIIKNYANSIRNHDKKINFYVVKCAQPGAAAARNAGAKKSTWRMDMVCRRR